MNNILKYTLCSLFALLVLDGMAFVSIRPRFLSADNGLSSNYIRCFAQDPRGYMWMGTTHGLIRYDGQQAKILIPSDLPHRQLMKDSRILNIKLWQNRYILVLLRGRKYCCYDTQTDQFVETDIDCQEVFYPKDTVKYDNRGNAIRSTMTGDIWLTDAKTKRVTHLSGIYNEALYQLNGQPRYGIVTDKDGLIWVSTYGNGLFIYDPKTEKTTHLLKKADNAVPIQTNYLINIFEDRAGNIWISQENMGVVCLTKQRANAERVFFTTQEQQDHTNSIHLLKHIGNTIYIGNRYNGLKVADGLLNIQEDISQLNDDVVAACKDLQGNIWTGSRESGVWVNKQNLRHRDEDPTSLAKGKISDIVCDQKGRVWISIFNGAVEMAEPDGKGSYRFLHFFTGDDAIVHPRKLLLDHGGYMWLCSDAGLYTFHPDQLKANPKNYRHISINTSDSETDEIHCICETRNHLIMAGTIDNGLAIIDNSVVGHPKDPIIHDTKKLLAFNNIQQLIEDDNGHVWGGSDNGLVCYDIQTQSLTLLKPAETELGNMFIENAVCKLDNGKLAFGSRHGIVVIDPKNTTQPQPCFRLRITDVSINGISVYDMENHQLAENLEQGTSILLEHNQNSLTFHFSDFEFDENINAKYSYRLKGHDNEWTAMSGSTAIYKNLSPGKYTMEITSQANTGKEDHILLQFNVEIRPPFWATWWAYLIYIGLAAAIITFVIRHFKRINELHNRIKVEEQLTEFKMQFFTNISHEFRTPLTIIRGAMERIQDTGKMPGELKQPISSMHKSVGRLMRMINQLLEFSKMHEGKLSLRVEKTDVVNFIRDIYSTFMEMAENKHMDYQFTTFAHAYNMYIDRNFLDKIAYNLISNAFKYTPAQRSIYIRLKLEDDGLHFIVEDTGIGVSKEKQAELFTRFNQSVFAKDSIGIGLHLTNELIRVHHGTICYTENPNGGSIFTVTLPTDEKVFCPSEIKSTEATPLQDNSGESQDKLYTYREVAPEPMNNITVLIVDDDHDVKEFINNGLQRYFTTQQASDGAEAFEMIKNQRPDLIVSDVMMPVMDGFELTKRIRAEQELADIPIILLTALDNEEKHVKGLGSGADSYITKPFSMQLLISQCVQLLEQRNRLRTSYAQKVVNQAETPALIVDEQEKKLRVQLDTWLTSHLNDPQLNIDQFAQKMGYGRTTFFKKVKHLTGQTPNDYIKTCRMEQAIKLLQDDTLTIAQVSYQIGIEDPYYFSKLFKNYFGITPTQYRKGETPKSS